MPCDDVVIERLRTVLTPEGVEECFGGWRILAGFHCGILASDPYRNPECVSRGVHSVSHTDLYAMSDIIALHCPPPRSTL